MANYSFMDIIVKEAPDVPNDDLPATGNPPPGKVNRVASNAGKALFDSNTWKTLIILVSGSVFAFLFAANMGLLGPIAAWERSGSSTYRIGQLAAFLLVLSVAIATILFRRYQEIREESRVAAQPDEDLTPARIRAGFQYEQLEALFRQVEAAKREWQMSLDSIRDMVVLADCDGTIHRCNRAFKEFLGLSYEEILQKNIASLLVKFGIEMKELELKSLNARFHISGKWFGVRSYPYTDFETGNITRVAIIMRDVQTKSVAEEKVRFVWGNKTYSRLDGGKESSSHPDSDADIGEPPTAPPEAPARAAN